MITIEKIKIYKKYGGDVDFYVRLGRKGEKAIINDGDFFLLDELLQDLTMVKNGLAGASYSNSVNERLKENCDGEETIEQLKALVESQATTQKENETSVNKGLLQNLLGMFKKKNDLL